VKREQKIMTDVPRRPNREYWVQCDKTKSLSIEIEHPRAFGVKMSQPETPRLTEAPSPGKRLASTLGTLVVVALCVLLVTGAAIFAFNPDPQKSLFGYRFYNVLTGSMTPSPSSPPGGFSAGDMIFVKLGDPAAINVGDIITYTTGESGSAYLTHRVVDIKTEMDGQPGLWFITRGDTNNVDDLPVTADRVIGVKVFSVPMLGAIFQSLRDNPFPLTIFLVATLGFIFVVRAILSRSKAKKRQSEAPTHPNYNLSPCKAVDIDTTLPNGKTQVQTI
jgi:signal peptidase I